MVRKSPILVKRALVLYICVSLSCSTAYRLVLAQQGTRCFQPFCYMDNMSHTWHGWEWEGIFVFYSQNISALADGLLFSNQNVTQCSSTWLGIRCQTTVYQNPKRIANITAYKLLAWTGCFIFEYLPYAFAAWITFYSWREEPLRLDAFVLWVPCVLSVSLVSWGAILYLHLRLKGINKSKVKEFLWHSFICKCKKTQTHTNEYASIIFI